MQFRPCIDIHNGKVKQIVGSSLKDRGDQADENFVAGQDAEYFASIYRENHIKGGHVILLNSADSPYFRETKRQAMKALEAYPGGLQIGGGINDQNAVDYIGHGASHVIVTSFVFEDGRIWNERIDSLVKKVGKDKIVLDVSCQRRGEAYYLVTDRWQKQTEIEVNIETLERLSRYCDEFLIHAVDVEGKANGIEAFLVESLAKWNGNPITYAGGVHSFEDLKQLNRIGQGRINVTIGSALDLFGGSMDFKRVMEFCINN